MVLGGELMEACLRKRDWSAGTCALGAGKVLVGVAGASAKKQSEGTVI